MYLYVMGIDVASFYDFGIWFGNNSYSVAFFQFHFISISLSNIATKSLKIPKG